MRQLIVSALVTLNGTVTNQQDWATAYFDAEAKSDALKKLRQCDHFLLGRVTYEQFAPVWSRIVDDEYFATVNAMPKYVISNSLKTATWNAEVFNGDAAEKIRALKKQPGKAIMKYGITALDRTLIEHQLIDQFQIAIYPVIADGVRIFDGINTSRMQLEMLETKRYANGVVQLTYRPKWLPAAPSE